MHRILVPLDGSPLAEQALPYAQLLAAVLRLPVGLIGVVGTAEVDGLVAGETALQHNIGGPEVVGAERTVVAREVLAERSERYLAPHLADLQTTGISAGAQVVVGRVEEELAAVVRAEPGSLLVMVPHSYDGNAARPSSRVTDAIIQAQVSPVLVVRSATVTVAAGDAPLALHKLLVPIDAPERAKAALDWAIRLARPSGAAILLLHADLMAAHDSSLGAGARQELSEQLRVLAASVQQRHGVAVSAMVTAGVSDDTIVEVAERNGADLIVMGSEGRGWLARQLGTSVSDNVRRNAPVPVLIVPRDA